MTRKPALENTIVADIELLWQGIIYILRLYSSIERRVQLPMLIEETDCGMTVMETTDSSDQPPLMCNLRSFLGQVTSFVGLLCVAQSIVGRRRVRFWSLQSHVTLTANGH